MSLIKFNKSVSGASWFLLIIAAALLVVLGAMVYRRGGTFISLDRKNPPVLVIQKEERAFEILSKGENGYQARALDGEGEVNLILGEKNLKAKTIVVLKKYVKAADGLVAEEWKVLPPVPTDKPTGRLPERPE